MLELCNSGSRATRRIGLATHDAVAQLVTLESNIICQAVAKQGLQCAKTHVGYARRPRHGPIRWLRPLLPLICWLSVSLGC